MMATILALVCAFQAFQIEVVSGGVTIIFQEIVIVLLSWLIAMVAFIFTLMGMVSAYKERQKKASEGKLSGGPGNG